MNSNEALSRLRDVIRRQHLSLSTEKTYCGWLRRFVSFLRMHPDCGATSGERLEAFLTDLARERCSSAHQNQALNAVVYFYRHVLEQPLAGINALRANRPAGIRIAPSEAAVNSLFAAIADTPSQPMMLIAHLLYGCGLRLSEVLDLRLKDIDFGSFRIWIRDSKHGRDRLVLLPATLVGALAGQVARGENIWREDFARRIPVPIPGLLRKKFRHAEYSRDWCWLFPAAGHCTDPRMGRVVRWRCHPALVQRAFALASERAGLRPAITPHYLRHAYATHCLERGVNVRALQAAMGHKSLETTMGYLHADALSVVSPLDRAPSQPQSASFLAAPQR
jgi:site-specific recombinase XerD